jgi:uncharacterized Tic20 family protein
MSRRQFVCSFMVLAICFVPIVISFGLVAWAVPLCWGLASLVHELVDLDWRPALGFGIYVVCYLAVFYVVARVCYYLIGLTRHSITVACLQITVLLALFSCSFLRVLTYGSIQGSGGTYTFWTAVDRVIEKRSQK